MRRIQPSSIVFFTKMIICFLAILCLCSCENDTNLPASHDKPTTTPDKPNPEPDKPNPEPDKPNPEPDKPNPEPDKPNPEPDKPNPEPDKPNPEPDKPNPEPDKPNPEPDKPNPEPDKPNPEPDKPNPEPDKPNPEPDKPIHNISFAPTDEIFPNPERGFYCWGGPIKEDKDPKKINDLDEKRLSWIYQQDFRLIYLPIELSEFRNADISNDYIKSLQEIFSLMRKYGLKAILRFAYDFTGVGNDTSPEQIKKHIQQLKTLIHDNADIIAIWQAGFIGAWGEWHSSQNKLDTDKNKLAIYKALIEAQPSNRQIAFRYPLDLMKWFKTPANENNLLSNELKSKIAVHNDCFLAGTYDVGTYNTPDDKLYPPEEIRDFVRKHSDITAFGGETCEPHDPNDDGLPRMECKDILKEGAEYHLTYLNYDYYKGFINKWENDKCINEIKRKIGYRFELQNLKITSETKPDSKLHWTLKIANNGWSRIMYARPINLRLTNANNTITLPLPETNLRNIPAATSKIWNGEITLPTSIQPGEYELEIGAPDPAPTLKEQPQFSVRFANKDQNGVQWNPQTGFLKTGLKITIKK